MVTLLIDISAQQLQSNKPSFTIYTTIANPVETPKQIITAAISAITAILHKSGNRRSC